METTLAKGMSMDNARYDELLDAFGFKDGAEVTADGSANNDLAHESAEAAQALGIEFGKWLLKLWQLPSAARQIVCEIGDDYAASQSTALQEALEEMRRGETEEA